MKNIAITALVLLTAACSSNNSKKPSDGDDPGFTNPGVDIEAPIEEDKGYKVIDGSVYFDGEILGTIETSSSGQQTVVDADGNTIAHIVPTMGGYQIVIEHAGSGQYKDHYYISPDENGNWQIDWANSIVDHGWGAEAPVKDPKGAAPSDSKRAAIKLKMQHLRASIKAKMKR